MDRGDHLPGLPPHAFGLIGFDPGSTLEKVLEMMLYLAIGLVTGSLEDRERRTRDQLRRTLDERERLQADLVRSERLAAMGQLSAGLAHEIRNPLASIKGAAEILGDAPPATGGGEGRARMLTILKEESTRLNEVLTRFLGYARPAAEDRRRLDLGEELRRLADLLAHRPSAPQVEPTIPPDAHLCEGDLTQVRQLLLNLGLNAAEAAGPAPRGLVRLELERQGEDLLVVITDNGPGFTPDAMHNLGTPFYTTRPGGTGLGLATSVRLARDHGGDLSVDPDYQDGARVLVRLPAAAAGGA